MLFLHGLIGLAAWLCFAAAAWAQIVYPPPQPEIADPYSGWSSRAERVLIVHDLFEMPIATRAIATALRNEGLKVDNTGYNPLRTDREYILPAMVADLHQRIRPYSERNRETVHIVCHGFGCIIAHALIANHRPQQLGHVLMLFPPYHIRYLRSDHSFIGPALQNPQIGTPNRQMLENLLANPASYPAAVLSGDTMTYAQSSRAVYALDGRDFSDGTLRLPGLHGSVPYRIIASDQHRLLTHPVVVQQVAYYINHGRFPDGIEAP